MEQFSSSLTQLFCPALPDCSFWLFDIANAPYDPEEAAKLLSSEEKTRLKSFVYDKDKRRFALSHLVLRHLLGNILGSAPGALSFETTPQGKPFLPAHPAFDFSLSHAEDWALLATGRGRRLGVDIEKPRDDLDVMGLAKTALAPAEEAYLLGCAEAYRTEAFFKLWTAKEAALKALGLGIAEHLADFSVGLNAETFDLSSSSPLFAQVRVFPLALPCPCLGAVAVAPSSC